MARLTLNMTDHLHRVWWLKAQFIAPRPHLLVRKRVWCTLSYFGAHRMQQVMWQLLLVYQHIVTKSVHKLQYYAPHVSPAGHTSAYIHCHMIKSHAVNLNWCTNKSELLCQQAPKSLNVHQTVQRVWSEYKTKINLNHTRKRLYFMTHRMKMTGHYTSTRLSFTAEQTFVKNCSLSNWL